MPYSTVTAYSQWTPLPSTPIRTGTDASNRPLTFANSPPQSYAHSTLPIQGQPAYDFGLTLSKCSNTLPHTGTSMPLGPVSSLAPHMMTSKYDTSKPEYRLPIGHKAGKPTTSFAPHSQDQSPAKSEEEATDICDVSQAERKGWTPCCLISQPDVHKFTSLHDTRCTI